MRLIEVDGTPGSWALHCRSFTLPQLAMRRAVTFRSLGHHRSPSPSSLTPPMGWNIPCHPLHPSLTSFEEPQIHTHSQGGHRVRGQGVMHNITILVTSKHSRDLEAFFFTAWTTLNQLQGGVDTDHTPEERHLLAQLHSQPLCPARGQGVPAHYISGWTLSTCFRA